MRKCLLGSVLIQLFWGFVFMSMSVAAPGSVSAESKIAYTCMDENFDTRICIINPDGSGRVQLTQNPPGASPSATTDEAPTWSPEGDKIAFIRREGNTPGKLYMMNADGSGLALVAADANAEDYKPTASWSPELPSSLASVSPFGQFVIVFMLGGISALWMTRRNSRVVVE